MLRNWLWAAVVVFLGCAIVRADDAAAVLWQCRKACAGLDADIRLERRVAKWQAIHATIERADSAESDMSQFARLAAIESLHLMLRVEAETVRKLRVFQQIHSLVAHGKVSQSGLEAIGSMRQLEDLDLAGTQVGDGGLIHLKGLANLKRLNLAHTGLTDTSLSSLKALARLEELDLSGNCITDAGLAELKGLVALRSLNLYATKVTGPGLATLKDLPRLEHLAIGAGWSDETRAGDFGQADLSLWDRLRWLEISYVLTDKSGAVLLPPRLERLDCNWRMAETLRPLPRHLQSVTMFIQRGSSVHMKALGSLPSLRQVRIENCVDSGLSQIVGIRSVRALALSGCEEPLSDQGMKRIAEMHQLESLGIFSGSTLTDARMGGLRSLAGLRELALMDVSKVTEEGFACLRELNRLRALSLGFADRQRLAQGMLSHVGALAELEELSIYGAALTDGDLRNMAVLKKIRRLDFSGTQGFSDEGLAGLMDALPNLEMVKRSYRPQAEPGERR